MPVAGKSQGILLGHALMQNVSQYLLLLVSTRHQMGNLAFKGARTFM